MSKIEVNQISSQCGSTLTVGQSGDTVTLASGASQTGFGRTGTVDWDTTKKTASFTAVSGTGYFVDTSGGAVTLTLPASPSAGDIVAFKDYAGRFATNNLTIGRNGSNLDGAAGDKVIDTNNTSMSLVYVDATQGWKSVEEGTGFIGENFIVATGGTETTCGDFKIHTFTGPGCFSVSSLSSTPTNNVVDYLVVAGAGGGGQGFYGAGGGAGGFRFYANTSCNPQPGSNPGQPLNNFPSGTAATISVSSFPITVGGGGAGAPGSPTNSADGVSGNPSTFSNITSAGGGGGDTRNSPCAEGTPGGSGGGGGSDNTSPNVGGTGNTPPVSPPQGQPGGTFYGGGGGGAIAAGGSRPGNPYGGNGGAGAGVTGFGTGNGECSSCVQYFSGGGAGGANPTGPSPNQPTGGLGGGGQGQGGCGCREAGTTNTGGGGGGGGADRASGGTGGSGIVIIRYKFQ